MDNLSTILLILAIVMCLANIIACIFYVYDCYKCKKHRQLQTKTIQRLVEHFEKEG